MRKSQMLDADAILYRDLVSFALEYGVHGTPKYRREAARCLRQAADMLDAGSLPSEHDLRLEPQSELGPAHS